MMMSIEQGQGKGRCYAHHAPVMVITYWTWVLRGHGHGHLSVAMGIATDPTARHVQDAAGCAIGLGGWAWAGSRPARSPRAHAMGQGGACVRAPHLTPPKRKMVFSHFSFSRGWERGNCQAFWRMCLILLMLLVVRVLSVNGNSWRSQRTMRV